MGQYQAKQIDIEQVWKEEEALTIDERRQRYRCRNYSKPQDLNKFRWTNMVDQKIKDVLPTLKEKAQSDYFETELAKAKKEWLLNDPNNKEEGYPKYVEDDNINKIVNKEMRDNITKELRSIDQVLDAGGDFKPLNEYVGSNEINSKIVLIRDDICTLEIDAVVNAANKSLMGGGGIDGAIHSAAGNRLDDECYTLGGCDTGDTKITRGYNLPAKFILHTVGPIGEDKPALVSCYNTILKLTQEAKHPIKHVALCGISSGIFGYPLYKASHVAADTVRQFLEKKENRENIDMIIFCTYLPKELDCYSRLLPLYFPPEGKSTKDVLKEYQDALDTFDITPLKNQLENYIKREIEQSKDKLTNLIQREIMFAKNSSSYGRGPSTSGASAPSKEDSPTKESPSENEDKSAKDDNANNQN